MEGVDSVAVRVESDKVLIGGGTGIEWPALVQPKLNGIRCLVKKVNDTTVEYTSRGGKKFETLEHLTPYILRTMDVGDVLDGELFSRDLTFQDITSAVKRKQDLTSSIDYWIYDIVQDVPFKLRIKYLKLKHFAAAGTPLKLVLTVEAYDECEMLTLHTYFIEDRYEGTMIRNLSGPYKINHRSTNLQKYKNSKDAEFEIIGAKSGKGKFENAIIWICVTQHGEEFDVVPKGTMEQRRVWWKENKKYIGKQMTVKYQTLSDDRMVPIFPVGLSIRDYE